MDATITHRLGKGARAPVGVAEAVNETRRRIGPLEARRLRIDIAPEVRRARIAGDRVALREMLRNLVDNAALRSRRSGGHPGHAGGRLPGGADRVRPRPRHRRR